MKYFVKGTRALPVPVEVSSPRVPLMRATYVEAVAHNVQGGDDRLSVRVFGPLILNGEYMPDEASALVVGDPGEAVIPRAVLGEANRQVVQAVIGGVQDAVLALFAAAGEGGDES